MARNLYRIYLYTVFIAMLIFAAVGLGMLLCQGRCNHEPILNWPPCLNELQRTTTMSAGEQTPTKLRQNQVIPTPTHKRRLPNASRLAASGAESHFR